MQVQLWGFHRLGRLLLCTGNSATLAHHRRYAALAERFASLGAWTSVWEEPWSEALG